MSGELERAFLEFREHGRPRAMARVFDLTAQELLLVAGNLVRRGEEAEELVQETYLEAMRRPEGWDASRPLLPWLLGILLRRQRAARRRRAEQRGREQELGLAAEPALDADPLHAAEERELAERLDAALRALPETYRDSLTLRLVHGLEPVQIAHALGRPLETVRTQLRRGKELLREALPRSLAALVALDTDGASALRRLVLAEADKVAAGSGLALAGGVIAMKKLGVVALVLVGAGLFWWRRSATGAELAPAEPVVASAAAGPAPAAAELPVARPDPTPAAREAVLSAPPSPVAISSTTAELRCRVVWDSDGTPAAGVRLELLHRAFGEVTPHPQATSDGLGLVLFSGLPLGDALVRADRGGEAEAALAAGANELELRIPRGVEVEGVVLDPREQPVAHAELWLSARDYTKDTGLWTERAGADGRFRLRDVQPRRALAARATGHAAEAAILLPGAPGERVEITLRVASSGARLRGLVRNAAGEPIAGAVLFVGDAMDTGFLGGGTGLGTFHGPPPESASTDADGRFEVEVVQTMPSSVWACAEGFAVRQQGVTITEPETRLEIELVAAASIAGLVRDELGNPAPSVEVFALQAGISESGLDYGPGWARPRTWSAADGSFRLERLRAGPTVLYAKQVHLCEARAEVELVVGEKLRWDARLRRGGDIAGVVVDERGAPLAGLAVSASSEEGGEADSILSTQSDAEGRFRLTGAVRERYLLSVRERHGVLDAPLQLDGIAPGTEGLELVFPDRNRASARFEGRLVDASGAPFGFSRLELRRIEPDSTWRSGSHEPSETDGRFETPLLPPGRYVLSTSSPELGRWTIGTFELAAGEARDIGTHACPAPGSLTCEVLDAEGVPLVEDEAGLVSDDSGFGNTVRILDGRGTSGPLEPGVYWIGFGGYGRPLVRERVEVRSGETAHATIRLVPALPRWIQTPAAPPRSSLRFVWEWRRDGVLVNRHASTVGHGPQRPLEFLLVPGHYEVTFLLEDGRSATTSFEVDDTTTGIESAVLLRSPLDECR
jgi:RNA polymerase sigma factor (sigma-70 family)